MKKLTLLFLIALLAVPVSMGAQCTGISYSNGQWAGDFLPSTCASLAGEPVSTKYLKTSGEIYYKTGVVGVNTWAEGSSGISPNPGVTATGTTSNTITASSTTVGTSSTNIQDVIAEVFVWVKRYKDSIETLHRAELNTLNSKRHQLATVTDGTKIDFTASGTDNQTFTATVIAGSLDSLDLGDLKTSPRRLNVSGGLPGQELAINAAGTAWTPRNTMQYIPFTGSVANSTTTVANVTGFEFPVTLNKRYKFKMHVQYTAAATTTGARFELNGPAITTAAFIVNTPQSNIVTVPRSMNAYGLGVATSASPFTATNFATVEGTILCSASGNVILRFASEINASAITVTGGLIEYIQLN